MKRLLPYIRLSILTVACQPAGINTDRPIAEWIADDTEGCLSYIDDQVNPLYLNLEYDSVITLCEQVFRALPDRPTGDQDVVLEEVRDLLLNFTNSCAQLNRQEPFIHLLDSLRKAGHPYLTGPANYESLSLHALACQNNNHHTEALALANQFATLPPSPNDTQEAQCCHIIAWVFRYCSDYPDTYIRMQERAVAAFRRGGNPTDAGDIYTAAWARWILPFSTSMPKSASGLPARILPVCIMPACNA